MQVKVKHHHELLAYILTCANNKIIEEMSMHPIFSLNYPTEKKKKMLWCL